MPDPLEVRHFCVYGLTKFYFGSVAKKFRISFPIFVYMRFQRKMLVYTKTSTMAFGISAYKLLHLQVIKKWVFIVYPYCKHLQFICSEILLEFWIQRQHYSYNL